MLQIFQNESLESMAPGDLEKLAFVRNKQFNITIFMTENEGNDMVTDVQVKHFRELHFVAQVAYTGSTWYVSLVARCPVRPLLFLYLSTTRFPCNRYVPPRDFRRRRLERMCGASCSMLHHLCAKQERQRTNEKIKKNNLKYSYKVYENKSMKKNYENNAEGRQEGQNVRTTKHHTRAERDSLV